MLDRANGKLLAANPCVKANWADKIDLTSGRPVESDVTKRARAGDDAKIWPPVSEPRLKTEQIEQGRTIFHRSCAQCHGRNMVNAGTTVADLRKFTVDDADRFQTSASNGKGSMPSFKDALSQAELGLLWAYVGRRGGKEN